MTAEIQLEIRIILGRQIQYYDVLRSYRLDRKWTTGNILRQRQKIFYYRFTLFYSSSDGTEVYNWFMCEIHTDIKTELG